MTSERELVLGFKTKFLGFFLEPTKKEEVNQAFEFVMNGLEIDQLKKATFYIQMFNNGNTDSEKIYFSKKAFEQLKPFFETKSP